MNQAVKAISSGKTLDSCNYLNAFLLTMWETKSSQSHSLVNANDKQTTWSFIWLGRRILLQYDYVTQNDLKKKKKIKPARLREQMNVNTSRQAEKPCPWSTRAASTTPVCYQQHGQAPSADGKCSQMPWAAPALTFGHDADADCKCDQASPTAACRGDSPWWVPFRKPAMS